MDQESLMASAWAQAEGVENTNRALRLAQLGRYASASAAPRHLARLDAANLMAVTERVSSRVLVEQGHTLMARVDTSVLPPAATAGTLRRLAAPRGRLSRFVLPGDGEPAAVARARAVGRLLADVDGVVHSWVRTYADPDALTSVRSGVEGLLPAEFRAAVKRQAGRLGEPALPEVLTEAADEGSLPNRLDNIADLAATITAHPARRATERVGHTDDIAADRGAAEGVADVVRQLLGSSKSVGGWVFPPGWSAIRQHDVLVWEGVARNAPGNYADEVARPSENVSGGLGRLPGGRRRG